MILLLQEKAETKIMVQKTLIAKKYSPPNPVYDVCMCVEREGIVNQYFVKKKRVHGKSNSDMARLSQKPLKNKFSLYFLYH